MSFTCSLIFANERAVCLGLLNEPSAPRAAAERRDGRKERAEEECVIPRGRSCEVWFFVGFFFFLARGAALLCNPPAAPLSFARSGFSGSLGEDAL